MRIYLKNTKIEKLVKKMKKGGAKKLHILADFDRTLTKANVEYRRPYVLRTTYANLMMGLGGSTEWLSRQMGHSSISMLTQLHPSYYKMANQSAESFICQSLETLNL